MSKACWTICFSCTHRYCEFCCCGDKYEKKQYSNEERDEQMEDEND